MRSAAVCRYKICPEVDLALAPGVVSPRRLLRMTSGSRSPSNSGEDGRFSCCTARKWSGRAEHTRCQPKRRDTSTPSFIPSPLPRQGLASRMCCGTEALRNEMRVSVLLSVMLWLKRSATQHVSSGEEEGGGNTSRNGPAIQHWKYSRAHNQRAVGLAENVFDALLALPDRYSDFQAGGREKL